MVKMILIKTQEPSGKYTLELELSHLKSNGNFPSGKIFEPKWKKSPAMIKIIPAYIMIFPILDMIFPYFILRDYFHHLQKQQQQLLYHCHPYS